MYRAFFMCLTFSVALLNAQGARADDFESLDFPPDEVLNAISAGNNGLPTYNNRTVNRIATVDRLDATFMVAIDFDPTPETSVGDLRELIWESGGGTIGFSFVYEHPNTLVLRAAGNGGNSVATARVELSQEQLDAGELDVAWTFDIDNGAGLQVISIIINDQVFASVTEDLQPDWSGGNASAFGGASTSLAAGGGNTSLRAQAFLSGTFNLDEGLAFYANANYVPGLVDDDGDGLPDAWELLNAGDLDALDDGEADADADGLNDTAEFERGTNPLAADTDEDGLDDGAGAGRATGRWRFQILERPFRGPV